MSKETNRQKSPRRTRNLNGYRIRLRNSLEFKADAYKSRSRENLMRGLRRTTNTLSETEYYSGGLRSGHGIGGVFMDGLWHNNPVLFNALGISIILGVADNVTKAFAVSVIVLIVLTAAELVTSLFCRNAEPTSRMTTYVLVSAVTILAIGGFLTYRMPALVTSIGIYLPLIAVTGLVTVRCESFAASNKPLFALIDAVGNSLGFAVVCISIALVREFLGTGMVLSLGRPNSFPAVNYSFFSFILIGLLTAGAQYYRASRMRKKSAKKEVSNNG